MSEQHSRQILCFAGNDWWLHNPSPEKQWMSSLARRGWKVLYVNSIGIGIASPTKSGVFARYVRKLRSMLRYLRRIENNLWVVTPIVLPFWSVRFVARLNTILLHIQLRILLDALRMKDYVWWSGIPTAAVMLGLRHATRVVYYYQDNYTAYYESMAFSDVVRYDDALLARADVVICASRGLHEKLSRRCHDVRYLPHGVHPVFFQKPKSAMSHDVGLSKLPHPILGYWGSLETLQDVDLIEQIVRRKPYWSFVFIGRPSIDFSRLSSQPNVHFLGYRDLSSIVALADHFDLCFMAFVQSDWIRYSCPVKLREYLALGKPVVSVPIIEIEREFGDLVRTAATAEEFISACEEELQEDSELKQATRRQRVAGYTWEHTTNVLLSILDEYSIK